MYNNGAEHFREVMGVADYNGCSFSIKGIDKDFALGYLTVPIGAGQKETYQIYKSLSKEAQAERGNYGIASTNYCIMRMDSEREVCKKVYKLTRMKPSLPQISRIDSIIFLLSTVRLAGGTYKACELQEGEFTPSFICRHAFLCEFPNRAKATLKMKYYTLEGKIQQRVLLNEDLVCDREYCSNYLVKLAGHSEFIVYSTNGEQPIYLKSLEEMQAKENSNLKTEAKTETEAIQGRREFTNEINRLCVKYGIKGRFEGVTGIPKYRWDGTRFVRVQVTTGKLCDGCVDTDRYTLCHPNGNKYGLFVDNKNGNYFLLVNAKNPDNVLAISTNQKDIIRAIRQG